MLCYQNHPQMMFLCMQWDKYSTIIIEGPDGTGKTTLAKALMENNDALRYEHLINMEHPYDMYRQFIEARNKITEGNIILDRYILSNMVYSYICSSIPVYDKNMFYEELLAKLALDKACLIFCLPSNKEQYLEEFTKLRQEREELITSTDVMSKIFDAYKCHYDELKTLHPNNVFQFDRFSE